MLQYVIRRMMWAVVMLVAVLALVFVIFFVLPGAAGKVNEDGVSPLAIKIAGKRPTEPLRQRSRPSPNASNSTAPSPSSSPPTSPTRRRATSATPIRPRRT
jgi:hypothetical protein